MTHHQQESEKNTAAENAHVRKSIWGDDGKPQSEDDMHSQTILGDVTHPTPIIISQQPKSSSVGPLLAGAAMAAALIGIPGAGVAGYLISKGVKETPDKPALETRGTMTDESLDVGLGRFSDLIKE